MKVLILITLLTISLAASADSFFFDHERGWHWYEIIETEEETEAPQVEQSNTSSPIVALKAWQQELEVSKARAVLEPTEANIRDYIIAQNEVARKSSLFSNQWQKVLWKNPELDYSLIKPTGLLAKQAYLDKRTKDISGTVSDFAKTNGLWFFFRSDCSYCHRFAPILKRITDKYGFHIMAISLDGGVLPDFPDAIMNQGQAERLDVKSVPAIFAVNPRTEDVTSISHGLLSEGEFLERIWSQVQPSKGAF